MAETLTAAQGLGIASAGLGILGAGMSYEQQRIGFQLQMDLAALSSQEEALRLSFTEGQIARERDYRLDNIGFQEKSARTQYNYQTSDIEAQQKLLAINRLQERTQQALEQNDLRTASIMAGRKARLLTEDLKYNSAAQGRSAFTRAGIATALSFAAPIEDRLVVAKQLGVLSEERFAEQKSRLESQKSYLEEQYNTTLERLQSERQFVRAQAEATTDFERQRSSYRQAELQYRQRAAQQQRDADPIAGLLGIGGTTYGSTTGAFYNTVVANPARSIARNLGF